MEQRLEEVVREVIALLKTKGLTVADARDVLAEVNESLDHIAVLK